MILQQSEHEQVLVRLTTIANFGPPMSREQVLAVRNIIDLQHVEIVWLEARHKLIVEVGKRVSVLAAIAALILLT